MLRHDRHEILRYASMQSEQGRMLLDRAGLDWQALQTLLVVEGARSWQQTAALLRLAHVLGWPWRLAWIAWLVPAPLRDAAYRWLARHRLSLFGRADACMVPPPGCAARFLD